MQLNTDLLSPWFLSPHISFHRVECLGSWEIGHLKWLLFLWKRCRCVAVCINIHKSCMIPVWVTEAFLVSDRRQDLPHVAVAALRAVPARVLTSTCVTHGSYPYYSLIYAVLWGKPLLSGSLVQIYNESTHFNREKELAVQFKEKSCSLPLE